MVRIVLLVALAAALGLPALAQEETEQKKPMPQVPESSPTPPGEGRTLGEGHWTPYDPPSAADLGEDAKVHIIQRGDTLWGLATEHLGDPYLWPYLWEVNQYILQPRWIYPGDPILLTLPQVVDTEVTQSAIPVDGDGVPLRTVELAEIVPELDDSIRPMATRYEVYCSNFLTNNHKQYDARIIGSEDHLRSDLSHPDVVYINQGTEHGVAADDEFFILRVEQAVTHPRTQQRMGISVRTIGSLRVIAAGETTATARIVQSCSAASVGNRLRPVEELAIPMARPTPAEQYGLDLKSGLNGYIIKVMDDLSAMGQGDIVNLDLGQRDGLLPGDMLRVYREANPPFSLDESENLIGAEETDEVFGELATVGRQGNPAARQKVGGNFWEETLTKSPGKQRLGRKRVEDVALANLPARVVGEVVIVSVEEETSTATIVTSVSEVMLGDRVVLKTE